MPVCVCVCASVCASVCVCVCVCACVHAYFYMLSIVSAEKILCFISTLIISLFSFRISCVHACVHVCMVLHT